MRIACSVTVLKPVSSLLAQSGALLAKVARARIATGVDAHTSRNRWAHLAHVQRDLVGARSELVRAHRDFSNLSEEMDLGVICPNVAQLQDHTPSLVGVTAITA